LAADLWESSYASQITRQQGFIMQTAKQDVEHLLHQLPDDSTLEDIQHHLYVLGKIKRGQQAIANGKRYTSEEARERLSRWITP